MKSTWFKAIKAGHFIGWHMLNERNVGKYYPNTTKMPKGHLNQTWKKVQSTKPKPLSFDLGDHTALQGKKYVTST